MSSPKCSPFSGGIVAGMSGVQIEPGATLSPGSPFAGPAAGPVAQGSATAALVAAYGASSGEGMSELTDVPMIEEHARRCALAEPVGSLHPRGQLTWSLCAHIGAPVRHSDGSGDSRARTAVAGRPDLTSDPGAPSACWVIFRSLPARDRVRVRHQSSRLHGPHRLLRWRADPACSNKAGRRPAGRQASAPSWLSRAGHTAPVRYGGEDRGRVARSRG